MWFAVPEYSGSSVCERSCLTNLYVLASCGVVVDLKETNATELFSGIACTLVGSTPGVDCSARADLLQVSRRRSRRARDDGLQRGVVADAESLRDQVVTRARGRRLRVVALVAGTEAHREERQREDHDHGAGNEAEHDLVARDDLRPAGPEANGVDVR